MPTKKPRIQALLEQDVYLKFKKICDQDMRSESQLGGKIITEYIKQYETIHGEIKIEK